MPMGAGCAAQQQQKLQQQSMKMLQHQQM